MRNQMLVRTDFIAAKQNRTDRAWMPMYSVQRTMCNMHMFPFYFNNFRVERVRFEMCEKIGRL